MNRSHLTARTRTTLSVPMRELNKRNLILGEAIDYGCGKGYDAKELRMDKFDPHYTEGTYRVFNMIDTEFWIEDVEGSYDVVTCHYVLNVIESAEEKYKVIQNIKRLLKPEGTAYVTVRRDIKESGHTSKGTYQCIVHLNLPILKETKDYCIYVLTKED